jgi:putative CocE/NonD family hydrolase
MRGTEMSQGNFSMWVDDKNDSQDLGNWITSQSWSNGKIFTFGASADGIGSMQTPMNNPSWLAAQYIAWAPDSMYNILFPNGNYKQETAEDWLLGVTMPNPDVVYDNIKTVHEHEMHDDFWAQIESTPAVYKNVHCPSAFWGGWYDLFIVGTLAAFDGYNNLVDESVRYTSKILIDPLGHCLGGAEYFKQNTIMGRTGLEIAQLFELYGIRPVKKTMIQNVTFYVMSSNDEAGLKAGQYWTTMEKFPEPKMVDYYLHADGTATLLPSTSISSSTSYTSDPSNPVITNGGNNLPPDIGGSIECGPLDQAAVENRADVLKFTTPVFDTELPLTGPMFAKLYVSSDAVDTDFMVKISDVYPTGEVRIIQDNAVRMRWREGGVTPVYMSKGKVYEVNMNIWNTSYIVAPGHSLRFSITSSNWPRFSVNPNNGLLLADAKYPGENVTATNTLYHSLRFNSKISLPVVSRLQLPQCHVLHEVKEAYPQITDEMIVNFSNGVANRMRMRMNKNKH